MLFFYSLALFVVLVLGSPYWLVRMATSGKYREGLTERLGAVPRRVSRDLAFGKPVIWVHAVSVGEVLAVSQLILQLQVEGGGHTVLISTTTRTGQRLARERFGEEKVFYFPLDFAWIVRRYLRALRPQLLVLAETEFWPNLLAECRSSQIPIAVVNARISDRSYPRYLRLRVLWRKVLSGLSLVLAQSERDVERMKAIGAPADRLHVGGNLKFDVRVSKESVVTQELRQRLPRGARLLVCGSTLDGEEQVLLGIWPVLLRQEPDLRMVLAPRHPERFAAVAELLARSGNAWVSRSEWTRGTVLDRSLPAGSILLLDSIGELASVYSLAAVAFVGGSLVAAGGHNPLEPAQFGVPIVMGPNYENFRAIVDQLREGDAIRIAPESELASTIIGLLSNSPDANAIGARALGVFRAEAGATDRAVGALLALLHGSGA